MFLALYFATDDDGADVACNDNETGLQAGWYAAALQRLADNGRIWNDAHTAALMGEPVG